MFEFHCRTTILSLSNKSVRCGILKWMLLFCMLGWGAEVRASEGSDIYKQVCATCHAAGVPGTPDAPKLGSRSDPRFAAEWNRRLFAGREGLLRSILNG